MPGHIYIVEPETCGWRVSHGSSDLAYCDVFDTPEEALAAAVEAARNTPSRAELAQVTTPDREIVFLD